MSVQPRETAEKPGKRSDEQHKNPKSDIEISQAAEMRPIVDVAADKLDIPAEDLIPYGHYKAKVSLDYIASLAERRDGKLILVTAITPTPAGEGKTTTTVGLDDALNEIGKKAMICIREPSLGPCFGVKGGAAGGGYAQVVPMEDINLHFTGDFHAIGAANNLLAAMIDNHIYWGNKLDIDSRRVTWRRAVDMNDRALRSIVTSLGGAANGFPREAGFDITVASEVMAIFCLASDLNDLQRRLGQIQIGQTRDKKSVTAKDLSAAGSMAALLRKLCAKVDVECVLADHWAKGGAGAIDLAKTVVRTVSEKPSKFHTLYPDDMTLWEKTRIIAREIYGASDITVDKSVKDRFAELEKEGFGKFPICVAKTQYSFTTNPDAKGAPSGFTIPIREVRLSAGAEFVVVICGDIMTMPGLPKVPAANNIELAPDGRITGLF